MPFSLKSWYRTGDEVIMRENGDIFITDRIKVREAFTSLEIMNMC